MSDQTELETPPASSPAAPVRGSLGPWILASGLIALALLAGLARPLSTPEAEIVLTESEAGLGPDGVQAAWSAWAGSMPRVLRGAGLLGFALGLAGLFWLRPRRPWLGLVILVALPAVWIQATGLAGGVPYLATVMIAAGILRAFGLGRSVVAGGLLVAVGMLPWFFAHTCGYDRTPNELDLAPAGLPLSLVGAAVLTATLVWRHRRHPLALLLIPVAASWAFTGHVIPLLLSLPAAAGVFALVANALAGDARPERRAREALTLLVPLAISLALLLVFGPFREADALPPRAADLDWVTTNVDQRALLVHHGPAGAHHRYLEGRGHRTGHTSVRSATAEELRAWADRAVLDDLKLIAITGLDGVDFEVAPTLGPRWSVVELAEQPASVAVYRR